MILWVFSTLIDSVITRNSFNTLGSSITLSQRQKDQGMRTKSSILGDEDHLTSPLLTITVTQLPAGHSKGGCCLWFLREAKKGHGRVIATQLMVCEVHTFIYSHVKQAGKL